MTGSTCSSAPLPFALTEVRIVQRGDAPQLRRATDFTELHAGVCDFVRVASAVHTSSDLLRLMRSLVDRGDARATFTPTGNAFDFLEQLQQEV